MKLSEIRGEQALDVLAEIIEPAIEIMADKQFAALLRSNMGVRAAAHAIKNHKKAVLTIMAALDGEPVENYNPSVLALPRKLLEIINDPEIVTLFQSQDQTSEAGASGPVSENTEVPEA